MNHDQDNLPLHFDPVQGMEVKEFFGAYGTLLFQMEERASDPVHAWLDTQPGGVA